MSDEKIIQVKRMAADHISGDHSGSVASLIDEICDCIDDAKLKREKHSVGDKKGKDSRYNSDENEPD